MSSWSIVSTVNEPLEVLEIFVNHHLKMGCSKIYLFFDNEDDPSKDAFAANPKVLASNSVSNYTSHEEKQCLNALNAYRQCSSEWLIHLDADELVHSKFGVNDILARMGKNIRQINIKPWEAVYTDLESAKFPFGTCYFRTALKPRKKIELLQDLYYPNAGSKMKCGLTGHIVGKSFIRVDSNVELSGIHFWKNAANGNHIKVHNLNHHIRLLHFDALSFPLWRQKLSRRVQGKVIMKGMQENRLHQLEAFELASAMGNNEKAIEALFSQLYIIDPKQFEALRKKKFIKKIEWEENHYVPNYLGEIYKKFSLLKASLSLSKGTKRHLNTDQHENSFLEQIIKLIESGDKTLGKDLLKEIKESEQVSNLPVKKALVTYQKISWSLIKNGFCEEAKELTKSIGIDLAFDIRRKVVPSLEYKSRRMIFICGLHRSGTTLVEQWLHSHYSCARLSANVPENEGQFLQDAYCSEKPFGGPGKFAYTYNMHGPEIADETIARDHEMQIRKAWEVWIEGKEDTLLEKSPPNITRISYLRKVFPGSKFIIWTRDPRAVAMATMKWSKTSYKELLLHWHIAYSSALMQLDKDCLVIRYEDFCEDSIGTVRKIANFANLPARECPLPLGKRFENVVNTNANYLKAAPKCEIRMPFRSWRSFGYDFE